MPTTRSMARNSPENIGGEKLEVGRIYYITIGESTKSIGSRPRMSEQPKFKLLEKNETFTFEKLGKTKRQIKLKKENLRVYRFKRVQEGGRTLRKSCNIPGAITNFLSRKYKTRRH
jgi:hypothetical protein